jgi:hypothetical protein
VQLTPRTLAAPRVCRYHTDVEQRRYAYSPQLRGQAQLLLWLAPTFLALLLFAAVRRPPQNRGDVWALGSLITFSVAAIPFALWLRSVVSAIIEIDDEAIRYRRGAVVLTIRWSDVRLAEYRRFAQRLKVVSTSGDVIYVDKQVSGFNEIANALAEETGRVILPARFQSAPIDSVMEISPSPWLRYLLFSLLLGAAYFLCVRWFFAAWRAHSIRLLVPGLVGAWLVFTASRNWWYQLGQKLQLDESGINYRTRGEETSISWRDISSARTEHVDGIAWFIVRDRSGEVSLALRREMFNWSGTAMNRFDQLAETARRKSGG